MAPKRTKVSPSIPAPVAAILTMDPASVSDSGFCIRKVVLGDMVTPTKQWARTPYWHASGKVWNTRLHDELGQQLYQCVPQGGRVLFAATGTAYNSIAMELGRAIGCIEGLLHALNVFEGGRVLEFADTTWRNAVFTKKELATVRAMPKGERRKAWKELAVAYVWNHYRAEVTDDAAEAILLSNYIVKERADLYDPSATDE